MAKLAISLHSRCAYRRTGNLTQQTMPTAPCSSYVALCSLWKGQHVWKRSTSAASIFTRLQPLSEPLLDEDGQQEASKEQHFRCCACEATEVVYPNCRKWAPVPQG